MKQDVLVEFINEKSNKYNPETGTYTSEVERITRYCNVTQLSAKRSIELFGEYVENTLVVRSTFPLSFKFNKVQIGDNYYVVENRLHSLNKTSVVVKKVSE